jgi:pimeloyl-ACP methyl ester carboxylesterase
VTQPRRTLLQRLSRRRYHRRPALVLVNGLAEQPESWYLNHPAWRRQYDVAMPNLLVYDGLALHRRIEQGRPITVDYLVDQLNRYLDEYVQMPPYDLVASSLGGKVVVEYAARYPEKVRRLVLLCPSGLGDDERLPIVEGVRYSDPAALVGSVFHDPQRVDPGLVERYRRLFANRRWRLGLLRTIRGTMAHSVLDRLPEVPQPTLIVSGREDQIVSPRHAEQAAGLLPCGWFVLLPRCGHAPQLERPRLINRLVLDFLSRSIAAPEPAAHPHAETAEPAGERP